MASVSEEREYDMAWQTTTQAAPQPVPEGEYIAFVADINEVEGPHGSMVRIDFTLTTHDDSDERQVSGLASNKLHENSKLGQWIAAILGRMPSVGEEVTAADLVHKECRVIVEHKENANGQVFGNVVQVLPTDTC